MYLEYHELLKKYKDAEKNYLDSLDKKSKLLYSVEPHATDLKPVVNHINSISYDDNLIKYADKIEEIDKLINSTRNTKDMLNYELKKKEIDLKASRDVYDRIYVLCWLNHKKPSQIYRLVPCSRSSAYNYKDEIKEILRKL